MLMDVMPRRILAGVGVAALFTMGVGAALADSPPTTVDPTTTATTTETQSDPTTTTQSTTMSTTTTTEASSTESTTTSSAAPPPKSRAARPARHNAIPAGASRQEAGAPAVVQPPRSTRAGRRIKRRRVSKPLRVTPPLGQRHFVFPVAGQSSFGDTYGAFRGDVHGKWHHGDDVFAALGTPVVAVASGTVNRIGWRKAGGWRLWVRDSAADEFYYAHLSGYSRALFHSRHVTAGQVIGFVGNTGDAFPGESHLHFEIHPRQLLRLHYDGAVDPTTYLESWTRLLDADASRPLLPRRFPKRLDFQREARSVFHELLLARHLIQPPESIVATHDRFPAEVNLPAEAAFARRPAAPNPYGGTPALVVATLAGLASLAVFATAVLLLRAVRGLGRARVSAKRT
jgi:murein DD-endopeptidase MepM/ murein hydrolase activator NlpD